MSWGHRLREENSGLREKISILTKENDRLKKNLEKTWELVAHVPGGLFLLRQETIVYANQTACDWLGCKSGQLNGKILSEVIDPEGVRSILEFIQDEAGNQRPDALRFKNSDGRAVYCAVYLKKIRHEGRKALLLNMIEIDRKIEQETEILEAQKVKALQRMAAAFVRETEIAAKPGSPLSSCLKDFAKQSYHPSEISLLNLNEIIETSIARYCSAKGIDPLQDNDPSDGIRFKTSLNRLSLIHGCKKDLHHAFITLLANALEALGGKGEIYLTTEEYAGAINVYVQENGIGIHESALNKIFDPFFTTKENGRLGLGLSLARAVMDRHGGKIKVLRHEAGGTTVHVKLPLDHQAFEIKDSGKKKTVKDARVLLVGKQNLLMNLLYRFLEGKHFNITHIDGYGESLKTLKNASFDLLLMDQGKDPRNTAWLIKKASDTNPDMPIVVFNVATADYSKFSRNQRVDLATKTPLNMDQLFSGISRLLAEGKTHQSGGDHRLVKPS